MATCASSPSSTGHSLFGMKIKKEQDKPTGLTKTPEKGYKCISGLDVIADAFTTEQVKRQCKDKGFNLKSPPKVKHGSAHMQLNFSKMTSDGKIAQEEQSTDYLLKLTSAKQECIEKANEFLKLAMFPMLCDKCA